MLSTLSSPTGHKGKSAFQKSELLTYIQVEAEAAETRIVPLSLLSLFVTQFWGFFRVFCNLFCITKAAFRNLF